MIKQLTHIVNQVFRQKYVVEKCVKCQHRVNLAKCQLGFRNTADTFLYNKLMLPRRNGSNKSKLKVSLQLLIYRKLMIQLTKSFTSQTTWALKIQHLNGSQFIESNVNDFIRQAIKNVIQNTVLYKVVDLLSYHLSHHPINYT